MKKTTMTTFNAISLFSGLGGDSLGLKMAGCSVIAYNELKPVFCRSHDSNFPKSVLIKDGINQDISKIDDEHFSKYKGQTDIIFAGFPCQGFSDAGKKMEDDPRNTMFLEFLRVTKIVQPKMIIGENVKGFLSRLTSKGDKYIDIIVEEFVKIGYNVIFQIFNTEKYNVPQYRKRLIILGVHKENPYGWIPSFPQPNQSYPNLSNIVKYDMTGSVKVEPYLFDNIPKECIIQDMADFNNYPINNGGHSYLLSQLNTLKKSYNQKEYTTLFSFGKRDSPIHCEIVDIRMPSKTIICTYERQPRLFVPLKNATGCYLRTFTPDELKQIQGFPKEYIVCGTKKEQIIQIGNAVPPPLIYAIVSHIIS